jgi:hypothetical protein
MMFKVVSMLENFQERPTKIAGRHVSLTSMSHHHEMFACPLIKTHTFSPHQPLLHGERLNHWFVVVAEATRAGGSDTMMMVFNNESEHGGGISFSTFSIFSSLVFSQSRK